MAKNKVTVTFTSKDFQRNAFVTINGEQFDRGAVYKIKDEGRNITEKQEDVLDQLNNYRNELEITINPDGSLSAKVRISI